MLWFCLSSFQRAAARKQTFSSRIDRGVIVFLNLESLKKIMFLFDSGSVGLAATKKTGVSVCVIGAAGLGSGFPLLSSPWGELQKLLYMV